MEGKKSRVKKVEGKKSRGKKVEGKKSKVKKVEGKKSRVKKVEGKKSRVKKVEGKKSRVKKSQKNTILRSGNRFGKGYNDVYYVSSRQYCYTSTSKSNIIKPIICVPRTYTKPIISTTRGVFCVLNVLICHSVVLRSDAFACSRADSNTISYILFILYTNYSILHTKQGSLNWQSALL